MESFTTIEQLSLIGHSHAICMMDALGSWRSHLAPDPKGRDDRYTDAFQGWFSNDLSATNLEFSLQGISKAIDATVRTFPIFDGMRGKQLLQPGTDGTGSPAPSPTLSSYIDRMRGSQLIVSALHGNEHAGYIFIDSYPSYDFAPFQPHAADLTAIPQPIAREEIVSLIEPMIRPIRDALLRVAERLPEAAIRHMLPPPPLEHPLQATKKEVFLEAFALHGVVEPWLRRKWYQCYCETACRMLAAAGIPVVHPPTQALTDGGFLAPELAEGMTHGNARYARLMWQQILNGPADASLR